MNLKTLKTLLIDGDGVLYRGKEPVPGLGRFFDVLNDRGINWALLTNNATRTLDKHAAKLTGLGIETLEEQVFSSASVTATYLSEILEPGAEIYVVGEEGVLDTLAAAGFKVLTGEIEPVNNVAAVVGSIDREVTYSKVAIASRLIRRGAPFIGTNPDRTFPTPNGLYPGAGTILAAIAAASDQEPTIIGKPEKTIFEVAMKHFNAEESSTAMLGDRLETDILGGIRAGIGTIAVLSGVATTTQIEESDYKPDLVFDSIAELADELNHSG
ncbi:MAG: HAD-IIA family hydrolase [Anaerolineae bacterium]|nr:HAD-IIA family hydrolase [Anaerolineae bacterium]